MLVPFSLQRLTSYVSGVRLEGSIGTKGHMQCSLCSFPEGFLCWCAAFGGNTVVWCSLGDVGDEILRTYAMFAYHLACSSRDAFHTRVEVLDEMLAPGELEVSVVGDWSSQNGASSRLPSTPGRLHAPGFQPSLYPSVGTLKTGTFLYPVHSPCWCCIPPAHRGSTLFGKPSQSWWHYLGPRVSSGVKTIAQCMNQGCP